jgi:hypothetical protein
MDELYDDWTKEHLRPVEEISAKVQRDNEDVEVRRYDVPAMVYKSM